MKQNPAIVAPGSGPTVTASSTRTGFRLACPALRERRKATGAQARAVARELSIPETNLHRIERGVLRASPARQAALALRLRRSIDELFQPLEPRASAERDEAIGRDFDVLRSAEIVARKHGVNKTTVYRALRRVGRVPRDRRRE
jgi:transcriptional regulator with XRE-family HTH domain